MHADRSVGSKHVASVMQHASPTSQTIPPQTARPGGGSGTGGPASTGGEAVSVVASAASVAASPEASSREASPESGRGASMDESLPASGVSCDDEQA
jgi:hypothetical protein